MENFTPVSALLGGALIVLSVTILLIYNGRMAGISGIMNGVFNSPKAEMQWRILFLAGLILGALLFKIFSPESVFIREDYPIGLLAGGGFLVGFGTRMGSGCNSGHGICGIANLSKRSIIATLTFMTSGLVTVCILRKLTEM